MVAYEGKNKHPRHMDTVFGANWPRCKLLLLLFYKMFYTIFILHMLFSIYCSCFHAAFFPFSHTFTFIWPIKSVRKSFKKLRAAPTFIIYKHTCIHVYFDRSNLNELGMLFIGTEIVIRENHFHPLNAGNCVSPHAIIKLFISFSLSLPAIVSVFFCTGYKCYSYGQ